jgi:putative transposase
MTTLCARFPLRLRMVEGMLTARGIGVTYETIHRWGLKFVREFANRIHRRSSRRGDKWHLDEVVIPKKRWLWCAVEQDGFVLDILVQGRREKKVAKRSLRKLLRKRECACRVLITDQLKRDAATNREIVPGVVHRQHIRVRTHKVFGATRLVVIHRSP